MKPVSKRRARFLRSAERRTQNVIHALRVLRRLANRQLHEFTEKEADEITRAIQIEAYDTCRAFEDVSPENIHFSLEGEK